eukprot:2496029-Pyramimonas_sp.AAC.1
MVSASFSLGSQRSPSLQTEQTQHFGQQMTRSEPDSFSERVRRGGGQNQEEDDKEDENVTEGGVP